MYVCMYECMYVGLRSGCVTCYSVAYAHCFPLKTVKRVEQEVNES